MDPRAAGGLRDELAALPLRHRDKRQAPAPVTQGSLFQPVVGAEWPRTAELGRNQLCSL